MAVHCTSTIRLFLHTFLFVNNSSPPLMSTSADMYSTNGQNNVSRFLDDSKATRPASGHGDLQRVLECMQMYMLPVFISLGVGGSALGLVVLLGTCLRNKFFSHFLVCLNVSCAAFLLTVFMSWLADNGVDVFSAPGLCQVHIFSSHFFTFLTVWHSVLGAYLVLYDWLKPGALSWLHNPTAAKTAVLGLSVLGFTMYSYKTWTHFSMVHKGSRVCTVIPENEPAMEILNVLDVLVLLALPSALHVLFVLIVILTRLGAYCGVSRRLACWTVRPAKGRRDRVVYTSAAGGAVTEVEVSIPRCKLVPRFQEVHRLVLTQSVCFLLLVTPRAISTLIVIVLRWVYQQTQSADDILLHHIFQFSFYFYFVVLPYCPAVSSSKFRLHCLSLFRTSDRHRVKPPQRTAAT